MSEPEPDGIRLTLLGRTVVETGGRRVRPAPLTAAVLIRLAVAGDEAVTVDELYRDVWDPAARTVRREDRVSVQKRILELRRLLDPGRPGEKSTVLRTERGRVSAYRLHLTPAQVDVLEFHDLVRRAQHTDAATAAELLARALSLWGGRPLFDAEDRAFAREPIRRLHLWHGSARRDLVDVYADLGRPRAALDVAGPLAAERPDDADLAATVAALRGRLRARTAGLLRRDFTAPPTSVVVTSGDLFAEDDAHLVAGFTDTFDTATDGDLVINAGSVQGQLLHRLYDGDRTRLDRDLRGALQDSEPVTVEKRSAKRHGKLARHPLGTVVPLRRGGRLVFAVAYSRMGNDLVARSSLPELRTALRRLWAAVETHGQRRPVALALPGTGLSRVDRPFDELFAALVDSFLDASRNGPVASQLRVVVAPPDVENYPVERMAAYLHALPERLHDPVTEAG
ncbi:hypothetical protein GCM10010182_17350 [Actinomadura cremea]|nr:hypothetical protein GCM10010182_17350 [Actinomadura cremea]